MGFVWPFLLRSAVREGFRVWWIERLDTRLNNCDGDNLGEFRDGGLHLILMQREQIPATGNIITVKELGFC